MAADHILNLDDFFSKGGGEGLSAIEKAIKEVDANYSTLAKNLAKNAKILDTQLKKTAASIKLVEKATKEADETTNKGRETIEANSKATEKAFQKVKELAEAKKGLAKYEKESAKAVEQLTKELKDQVALFDRAKKQNNDLEAKRLAKEIRATTGQINALNTAQKKLNSTLNVASKSYDGLVAENKQLLTAARRLNPEIAKERKELELLQNTIRKNTLELSRFDAAIGRNFRNVGNYQSALGGVSRTLSGLASSFGLALGGAFILGEGIRKTISVNAELSDSLANVRKTTGLTDLEVRALSDSLRQLNTRTSLEGLLQIAEEGGRLTVANDELEKFVKAVDILSVSLSDDFAGGTEEVASSLGKLVGLFKETRDLPIDEALTKTGSAINDLANRTKATASNITDFALRIGQLPESLRPTSQEALAIGAALEEVGIKAERATRPLTIFLTSAASDIGSFARQMNISTERATELINTDVTEFIKQFSLSLRGLNAVDAATTLKKLGLNANDVKSVLGALSTQTERLTQIQNISNEAFIKGTSALTEFELKNNTLRGSIDKLSESFSGLFDNTALSEALKTATDNVAAFFQEIRNGISNVEKAEIELSVKGLSIDELKEQIDIQKLLIQDAEDLSGMSKEQATNTMIYLARAQKTLPILEAELRLKENISNEEEAQLETQKAINSVDIYNQKELGLFLITIKDRVVREMVLNNLLEKRKEIVEEVNEEELQAQEDRINGLKILADARLEVDKINLKNIIDINSEIMKDEENSYAERFEAFKKLINARKAVLKIEKEQALTDLQTRFSGEENEVEKTTAERMKVFAQFEADLSRLNRRASKEFAEIFTIDFIDPTEKLRADLENSLDKYSKKVLKSMKGVGVSAAEGLEDGVKSTLSAGELNQIILDEIAFNAIQAINMIDRSKLESVDRQIEAIREQRDIELQTAGDNADARIAIERRFAENERKLQDKRKEEQRKIAEAEKRAALFSIAINTAVAVMKNIEQLGFIPAIPINILTVSSGLVQAALVASQPIPQFEKGTDFSPEGLAIVDEKGAELIQRPDGRMEIGTDKGARYTYLERGSKVIPPAETKQIIKDSMINKENDSLINAYKSGIIVQEKKIDEKKLARSIAKEIGNKFDRAVGRMPQSNFNLKGMIEKEIKRNGMKNRYQ